MASLPYPRSLVSFPQISQMVECVFSPTDFTDQHRCQDAFFLPRMSQISTDVRVRCYPTKCTLAVGGCSDCLVGAVETTAPPGRVRGYGRDAIPSYTNLNTLTPHHLTTTNP